MTHLLQCCRDLDNNPITSISDNAFNGLSSLTLMYVLPALAAVATCGVKLLQRCVGVGARLACMALHILVRTMRFRCTHHEYYFVCSLICACSQAQYMRMCCMVTHTCVCETINSMMRHTNNAIARSVTHARTCQCMRLHMSKHPPSLMCKMYVHEGNTVCGAALTHLLLYCRDMNNMSITSISDYTFNGLDSLKWLYVLPALAAMMRGCGCEAGMLSCARIPLAFAHKPR